MVNHGKIIPENIIQTYANVHNIKTSNIPR